MEINLEQVNAGAALYSKRMLACYDLIALEVFSRFIWRCSPLRIVEFYNNHVSANHLDVGVGTGYFLDRCHFPSDNPRLALMDLNSNCLEVTAQRIARYNPAIYLANVLEPIHVDGPMFDSISISFLLHCLPGTIRTKAVAFQHLKGLLNPGGVLFGSTLLHVGADHGFLARQLMEFCNAKKIFTNTCDNIEGLMQGLNENYSESSVTVVGCAALFFGRD